MKPSDVSAELRRMASAVRSPVGEDAALVREGVRRLVAALGPLWVMVDPSGPKATVFTSQEEAGQAAVEVSGSVSEVGSVGVICYHGADGKLVCEAASKLPCVGTDEPAEMAQNGDTWWFDTRTAVPGDVLESFASHLLNAPEEPAVGPEAAADPEVELVVEEEDEPAKDD